MRPQRVLLTGVSGFVGGALGAHLGKFGYHVIGIRATSIALPITRQGLFAM